MKPSTFQSAVDQPRVVAAIAAAEQRTSGEIRVVVSRRGVDDAVAEAGREFERLGMTATRERNAVLIFVAPKSQCFAVIGDEGVHRLCGEAFWSAIAAAMTEHFRARDFTGGLVLAIGRAAELLAKHFPRRPDDIDELPNDVVET